MVKLIACDIDGTLIPYGQKDLPRGLFPLIHALKEKGILFCPASGRQYHSMRRLFAPIADISYFLCENGAAIFGPGETEDTAPLLSTSIFPREDALALCRDIIACPGGDVFISGKNTTYVCDCSDQLLYLTRDILHNRFQVVDDPAEITEDIIKISVYCLDGPELPRQFLAPRWESAYHLAEAGPRWLDLTLADKGTGITALCGALNIDLAHVAAFGDNWNDLAMLQTVGHPYLMSNADPRLRELIPRQCDNVLSVLEEFLAKA